MGEEAVPASDSGTPLEVAVAIVGGGLGGLALAIGLQRLGIDAHVFEAAEQLRTDSGTIVSIARNGNAGLDGCSPGLSEAIHARGSLTETARITSLSNGKLTRQAEKAMGDGFAVVSWRATQEELAQRVNPALTHCGHRLRTFSPAEGGVDATFDVTQGGGPPSARTVRATLLVGADGMRSAVRQVMVGDHPRFLRCLNWNTIVPNPDQSRFGGHKPHEIVWQRDTEEGLASYLVDAGAGQSFWQVRKSDPEEALSHELGEAWGGFGKPGAKARALAVLSPHAAWDDLRRAIEATDESLIFERRIMDRLPLDKWSDASGHVVLLGDAAHGMFPGPGQGARTAFEDAHQLSAALKGALPALEPAAVRAAVARYESVRVQRCKKLQRFAAESSALPVEERLDPEVQKLTPEQLMQRFKEFEQWIESYPEKASGDPDSTYWK